MKDKGGNIIYVGKAKILKNRVNQYFQTSKKHSLRIISMISNIDDFDYIITDSEVEALILECNLIKEHMPRYNILLKDDKSYPYIKVTLAEDYPRVIMTRHVVKDGSKYFGPFMSSYTISQTLEIIKKIFQIRSCKMDIKSANRLMRPCLYYHIKQCSAPCAGKISKKNYRELFDKICPILDGKYGEIIRELKVRMKAYSENLEFEKAAKMRDRIKAIEQLSNHQKIISTKDDNRDIIGFFEGSDVTCVQVFYMRGGKILGNEHFLFDVQGSPEELLPEFVKQFYFSSNIVPKEILLPCEIEEAEAIESWLSSKAGSRIKIFSPKRGDKAKLVEMVNRNAEELFRRRNFGDSQEVRHFDLGLKVAH